MASKAFLQQAYLAYFGRPADPSGLAYYAEKTEAQVKAAFSASPESQAFFGSMEISAQINAIYQNLFNRDAEPAGLTYWAQEIGSGRLSLADAAMGILAGAQNDDKTAVANKLAASDAFTTALNTTAEMLGYAGSAAIAPARAFLKAVDATAASLTAATAGVDTSVNTVVNAATATPVVAGQTFTLTTSVDDVVGGAGADTIKGVLGTSGTYGVGDNINGGAGQDTLNLVTNGSGVAGGLVSLDAVEIINVRLLSSAGEAVTLNAADWNGVETITNASSLASTVLTVSGLALTTDVKLFGETTINAGFNNTTTAAAAVDVILSDAGSTTNGASWASGSAATINADANSSGLISAVNVNLAGTTNVANLEAGAAVKTYTVTGSGKGYLNTNDTITSFDASAATGNIDMTFSAVSDVTTKGGAGNDTFRFGANYSNSDSMDGGAGTDTIALSVGGFNRNLNTTNVENASVTFTETSGGTLNASASSVTGYTFVAGSANAANLSQVADGATFTLNDDSINGVTLDFISGAASTTLNIGSASGVVDIGALTITDVGSVTINGAGSGGAASGSLSLDSDVKSLAVSTTTVGAESDLVIAGSAAIALGGATTVSITSGGSASIDFGSAVAGASLATMTVSAGGSEAGDITIGTLGGSAVTAVTLIAGAGADIELGDSVLGAGGSGNTKNVTLAVTVDGASSNIAVGAITVSGQGSLTIDLAQNATGNVSVGAVTLAKTGTADAAAHDLIIDTTTVIGGATAGIASVTLSQAGTGAQLTMGAVTVGADGAFTAGAIDASTAANVDVSNITVTLGASSEVAIGDITTTGGVVGSINATVVANASAGFGNIIASAMGSITVDSSGGRGWVDVGNLTIAQTVGSIEVTGAADNSDVTIGTIGASAVGAISVAGAGNFTVGKITSTSVGSITSTQGVSGQFTINLSGVTNAVEVNLGAATNSVISGGGDDVITLTRGTTGNDTIQYGSGQQGTDYIVNFGAGASATAGGADLILINASATRLAGSDAILTTASSVVFGTASGAAVTLASGATMVLFTTAYANTAAFLADATADLTLAGSGAMRSGQIAVVWGDGVDSYVSLLGFNEGASAGAGVRSLNASGSGISVVTLAQVAGVTPGALIAANFDLG